MQRLLMVITFSTRLLQWEKLILTIHDIFTILPSIYNYYIVIIYGSADGFTTLLQRYNL